MLKWFTPRQRLSQSHGRSFDGLMEVGRLGNPEIPLILGQIHFLTLSPLPSTPCQYFFYRQNRQYTFAMLPASCLRIFWIFIPISRLQTPTGQTYVTASMSFDYRLFFLFNGFTHFNNQQGWPMDYHEWRISAFPFIVLLDRARRLHDVLHII